VVETKKKTRSAEADYRDCGVERSNIELSFPEIGIVPLTAAFEPGKKR
jgi:hypothetical protein